MCAFFLNDLVSKWTFDFFKITDLAKTFLLFEKQNINEKTQFKVD